MRTRSELLDILREAGQRLGPTAFPRLAKDIADAIATEASAAHTTTQTLDIGAPDEGGQLLFFIECPDCDTRRGFRTGNTWMALTNAELRGMRWETECELCGRKFRVVLAFGTTPEFWTTKQIEVDGVPIIDSNGLKKGWSE